MAGFAGLGILIEKSIADAIVTATGNQNNPAVSFDAFDALRQQADAQKASSAAIVAATQKAADAAVRNTASSERLEKIFGPKTTEAAKLGVVATERAEAITSEKLAHLALVAKESQRNASMLARGDSRAERSAISRASLQQRAAIARAAAASRATTEAIKDKDLSVTANFTAYTTVSLRDMTLKSKIASRIGHIGGV